MNHQDRLSQLFAALGMEIVTARAGSTDGQLPILDLLGNLRDQAQPEKADLHRCCAEAWERMVLIVESGKPFKPEEITWLNGLLGQLQSLAGAGGPPVVLAPPPPPPAPPPPRVTSTGPTDAELEFNLNLADDGDLLREFVTESREHLDNIEEGVLVLEQQPDDAETLHTVFRAFHTFKGSAGFLNLTAINSLAHVLESLLDLARHGELAIDATVIELILNGRDVLKQFLDEIEGQLTGARPAAPIRIRTAQLRQEVQAAIDGWKTVSMPEPTSSASPAASPDPAGAAESRVAESVAESPASTSSGGQAPAPEAARGAKSNERAAMVKVDTAKLDGLLDLVGEMVIAQSLVGQDLSRLASLSPEFARNIAQLGRITKELQRMSMSLRMVPIRGVFQKMARVARDLSAKQQKKVQFLTAGDDTELDRGMVEELSDPLLHMIRNSMDHGIEPPDKRVAAGKPPVGTLQLQAYHQGGNIVVEIQDDGAGLDRERILKKAIERGLTDATESLTDEQVFGYVFAPGFSTAEKVTELSGRGVGLDVVRRNIEHLRGRVDISSIQGKGTTFKLTLPLTLAIIDGLIVKVAGERYIIPTLSVRESFRPQAEMVHRIQGRGEVVNVRGRLIPLLRLDEYFGTAARTSDATEGIVVVAQVGASVRALLVDALLHKQEVVIKNLNDMLVHKNRALAGAAILGDGRVGLILDVNALVHLDNQAFAKAA